MNSAYKKECWLTLIAFLVAMFVTHIFPLFFLFEGITKSFILGFPTHYFLTMVIGWLALMPLYWIYIGMSERIDREIEGSRPTSGSKMPEGVETR